MARKFPRDVRVKMVARTAPTDAGPLPGHDWEALASDGTVLTFGWYPGTRAAAREAAWLALEATGLVIDE